MIGMGLTALLFGAACSDIGLNDPDQQVVEPVTVEERFEQSPYPAIDVLFVIDSTGSMADEQAGIAAAAEDFVAALERLGVAWQIGVTTMDPEDEGALGGRPWILTPSTEAPAAALAAAFQVGTASPPPSAGLDAAVLAFDPDNPDNVGFRRLDAALHVVFVSDGDDESGAVLGEDPAGAFLDELRVQATLTGRAARASAVVDDGSGDCDASGFDTLPGTRFVEVAEASGGRVASVCTVDFSGVAEAIGDVGVEGYTVFPLQADPADGTVYVTVAGERQTEGWVIDHAVPALVFAEPPPLAAEIRVRYELAE